MLEGEIRELRLEVRALREAVEKLAENAAITPAHPQVNPAANTPASQPEYLKDTAAARLINISVASLRRWRLLRQGPPFRKIGSAVRYPRTELLAWVAHQPGLEEDLKGKPSNK
ncbi:MAG: helix-turn-helix domain-containing protein [Bryobacteraceae bacterium]|nr:helix-turn-helix domain-containing protein [Bryobacteraceae bacterium]